MRGQEEKPMQKPSQRFQVTIFVNGIDFLFQDRTKVTISPPAMRPAVRARG